MNNLYTTAQWMISYNMFEKKLRTFRSTPTGLLKRHYNMLGTNRNSMNQINTPQKVMSLSSCFCRLPRYEEIPTFSEPFQINIHSLIWKICRKLHVVSLTKYQNGSRTHTWPFSSKVLRLRHTEKLTNKTISKDLAA